MVFFTDRDIGATTIPTRLRESGLSVEVHRDHFPPMTPDDVWIRSVAEQGWTMLSQDSRIARNPLQRSTVMTCHARLIILSGANRRAEEVATNFVTSVPAIERFLADRAAPFIARLWFPSQGAGVVAGRIEMMVDARRWAVLLEDERRRSRSHKQRRR